MVEAMLQRACTKLSSTDKPILHSDQGWQYRMPLYREFLQKHAIEQSMSRRGNCLDNAAMESFFGTLKAEFYHMNKFRTLDDLKTGLRRYIHYYNCDRIKLKLGGMSPVEYRARFAAS
jgi:transposase InsO family protein